MPESGSGAQEPLGAEDRKLVTLARATRARVGATEGAAVRDTDGRTYAAAAVTLHHLRLSALAGCVAMAHSSGSRGLEAAVRLGGPEELAPGDAALLREFGGDDVVVHLADERGTVVATTRSGEAGSDPVPD